VPYPRAQPLALPGSRSRSCWTALRPSLPPQSAPPGAAGRIFSTPPRPTGEGFGVRATTDNAETDNALLTVLHQASPRTFPRICTT
jgi:hypothetical protein